MKGAVYTLVLLVLFSLSLVYAGSVEIGSSNIKGVVIEQPAAAPVNNNTLNVNNSQYLQGYTPSTLPIYNATINNLFGQNCSANQYAYFIQVNGTVLCRTDQTGSGNLSGGGDPGGVAFFDAVRNIITDYGEFYWDNAFKSLGLGGAPPSANVLYLFKKGLIQYCQGNNCIIELQGDSFGSWYIGDRDNSDGKFLISRSGTLANSWLEVDRFQAEANMSSNLTLPVLKATTLTGEGSQITNRSNYVLPLLQTATFNPVVNTTYHVGGDPAAINVNYNLGKVSIPENGTIDSLYIRVRMTSAGGITNVSHRLRINNVTEIALINGTWNGTLTLGEPLAQEFNVRNIGYRVNAGDNLSLMIRTPTSWSPAPGAVRIVSYVYIK